MNSLTLILGVLLCLTVASARHLDDRKDHEDLTSDDHSANFNRHRDYNEPSRHRRRRWQMGYGYDYPPPSHGYYPERREYERNQQELQRIIKLLEEISENLRRPPPPPPQPIYIPYPVLYPGTPRVKPCDTRRTENPNVTSRFPEMEDSNQNWGFVPPQEDTEDYDDGIRPISFEPIKPKQPMRRPAPKVEHGSSQAGAQQPVTPEPVFADQSSSSRMPSRCSAAILSCCANDKGNQKICFNNFGCGSSIESEDVCSSESTAAALESFKLAYSPIS